MRLLACGAHADDVELSCAGTLALAAAGGNEVFILDLTAGEMGSNGDPATRAAEAAKAAEILAVAERFNAGLPDGQLQSADPAQRRSVVEWLRRIRPEILLIPTRENRHPDHVQAHRLLRECSFLAGLNNYPADGRPFRPRVAYEYMERVPFQPNFVVRIDAFIERKREALLCYASQFQRAADRRATLINSPGFLEQILARDRYYGGLADCEYGEPFLAAQLLRIDDPALLLRQSAADEVFAEGRPEPEQILEEE